MRVDQVQVINAFWALVGRRLPLDARRDRVFVSIQAWTHLVNAPIEPDVRLIAEVDLNLRGVEMRLESRCSP